MTQVDFYIIKDRNPDARLTVACRIAEKAMQKQHQVLINTASKAESKRLDELLWTFSQGSFVPHRVIEADADQSGPETVLIGCGTEPAGETWDLLINLASDVPEFFSRYQRVAELVDGDEQRRQEGRERFRYYRDRGYELNTHNI